MCLYTVYRETRDRSPAYKATKVVVGIDDLVVGNGLRDTTRARRRLCLGDSGSQSDRRREPSTSGSGASMDKRVE